MFERPSEFEFVGVALISERPVVDVEQTGRIVVGGFAFEEWVKIRREIEIGDSCFDAVLGVRLTRYLRMYTFHDEIGVVDETREGPG